MVVTITVCGSSKKYVWLQENVVMAVKDCIFSMNDVANYVVGSSKKLFGCSKKCHRRLGRIVFTNECNKNHRW